MKFERVAIIGLGLLGGSIGLAVKEHLPQVETTGWDRDPATRARAAERGLVGTVCETGAEAVAGADLVVFCVPVGAIGAVAADLAAAIPADAVISDVGSSKLSVAKALAEALPGHCVIPAHPVAGTERSGPDAGFASLFHNRWCIITPPEGVDADKLAALSTFWEGLGAKVELMDPQHHDLVLAVTSHLPHLIAYTIVGTASDLEGVTQSEVIKYSAGGFRDFTRIAASDPTMWRDVFLTNKDAVLEMLQRFSEDLTALQRAIRWGDGDTLFELFTRTRDIRRSIIEQGQDDARPDFGRSDHAG
ncbi:prephenate/arogenate dehydrogenase family protein [Novosphingobium sp.]|jgi:cyclohexadieny/prephenate dehydrogenase|uniref:prephenate/arogenate dehydrogenase family protein n=1 Tax=Novosphingobium sp. TaxID=1874826 RepID=UPI0022BDE06B|nr:prephenate/arogenate dehydrogenase family protein [Novosphingobium sp.]MCZ8020024.1 prephenate/arogenate dehydrogenase family protein [Novosphingobium sp.]MCZ8035669.1 prephenate/arogenate dehydrogenase family protein [Novosphingobium sp.]MCZ8053067.1 prephenate/arogenate dehydrogenase family protein [Novosphingobium sp.]MCZ8061064.1 prephenate/arogenate dehydrogenase family protein [Novosphingobium sp.]MCZ8230793.1 prephenate/arogenate dehydrogenase family protein [Novosphingobium sp.]